jgi:outer membrane receptor protein involved in Fe transport
MRFLGLLLLFFTISLTSFSQTGKVEGKVTDSKSGAKLSGVSVSVEGTNAKASTNTDGYFQITLEAGKTYTLKLTSVGYSAKNVTDVEVKANGLTNLDIILDIAAKTETGVIIKSSSARKETVASMIAYQKNTTVVAEVVSAEAIRRSPDKNTGEVLKRIPGLSLVNGKYLVVRGLADRYNQVTINGFLMSSTEPDRKTFSFNIIPSALVDNIVVNKTFIPELPGEWAGGLIQINTKDVPAKNFLYVQIGPGFNTQTVGNNFYSYQGSKTDFLGFDSHVRSLPESIPLKADFAALDNGQKTAYGKDFKNIWNIDKTSSNVFPLLDQNFLMNGGFNKSLGGNNKMGAVFSVNYIRNNRKINIQNQVNLFQNNIGSLNFTYDNDKYAQEVLASALANFTFQFGNNNKITFKNMLNVNTVDYTTVRTGKDYDADPVLGDNIQAYELAYKANTYYNLQLSGDHNIVKPGLKFHWFGSFNLLDQYIPDQRRVQYNQDDPTDVSSPYSLLIGGSKSSQKSGSRFFGTTNDYVYTAGGDLGKSFLMHDLSQTVKGGYFFQVKDRLFDARPFAIYLPSDNPTLRHMPVGEVFASENFGTGYDNQLAFNELSGSSYRYLANSILNAGYLQFDNQLSEKIRAVWGVRVENFDQVIGSMKQSDPRFVHNVVTDWLPGVNLTYKVNDNTNVRLAGSQTVVRPEFRELSTFQFYDFDLGATVAGNPSLVRTKVTNLDVRYELYPASGELFTFGVFYKYFKDPIEAYFNISSGSASSYNFLNADEATSFGVELDFRKKLDFSEALKNFTFQGNLSYIYNRVSNADNTIDRPMQGQSPYLVNAGLQYDLDKYGLNTTLLFNQIGRRIIFVGGSDQPPVWENPRGVLDFQIAKKIIKGKGVIRLNISDIFNQEEIYYNDLNDNKKYDPNADAYAVKRKLGTNFSIAFGYNF